MWPAPNHPKGVEELAGVHEWFRRMRAEEPVLLTRRQTRRGEVRLCQVFSHDAVSTILNDHARFSSEVLVTDHEGIRIRVLTRDEPDHRILRNLVQAAFTRRAIARMSERIAELTQELLDGIRERGEMEVVHDFAELLPARVIGELLGVPASDREIFQRWATGYGLSNATTSASSPEVRRELRDYFAALLAERRRSPREDLVSLMSVVETDGERLKNSDLIGLCSLILIAGQETMKNLLTNFFVLMSRYPDSLAQLVRDPGLAPGTAEEVLRFMPSLWYLVRRARTDVQVGGVTIPERSVVIVWMASANRDETKFAEPDRFDVTRQPNHHMSFGHGIHFCLGAPLARLQASIVLPMLAHQLRNPRIARPDEIRLFPGVFVNVENVHVTFDPAGPCNRARPGSDPTGACSAVDPSA